MSVPRDTAATKQKMEKPLQLVCNKDGKLQLNPEALKVLQSIEDPMVVVAVVGAARTGKSYLMNCLAGDKKGFSMDSTVQAHTKGISMWCRSLPQRPNEVLLLLDTEGLGDPEKGDIDNDNSIYTLAILLSSILIYNGQKQIDQQSLQYLHFVTEVSKRILLKSQPNVCDSWNFVRFFPEFVWVIRDLTLDMHIDGKDVTPNEYLEHSLKLDSEISEQDKEYNELRRCIRNHFPSRCCFAFPTPTFRRKLRQLQELEEKDLDEDFVKERQNLINYIHTHKKVKRVVGGQLVTGRRFVELTKVYVGMMADGVLPCVENCVAKLAEVENQAAVDEALKFYDNEMRIISESGCLTMSKLIENYNMKSREAFNIFHKRSMNNNSGKYIQRLERKMHYIYKSLMAKIKETSQEQCKAHLAKEVSSIEENLASRYYQRPGGFQELKEDLDKAIKEYEKNTKDEMEGCAFLTHFLEEVKPHLAQVQKIDSKLVQEEKHVSALEEELSRVKQEMEKMKQERKAAEEHRNKEIKEQNRKMFEKGKKCSAEELKEAMEHMRSEMEKYKVEGREEDVERARRRYEYLKKKYEEPTEWSFMKFIREHAPEINVVLIIVMVTVVEYKKALEKELSRMKYEKEKEQERKVAEEHRNKEIKEQIRKTLEEGKKCSVEELKKVMRSEMEKYKVEGRMEDAERAQQRYEYLEKYKEPAE
ncbi:guanylate-binding protein 1-like [Mobula hypostoma]|uniref:guanylate-binding protein 1-like n=1 Tax=Mobula hypostoma TaxID=723540 RepID=UPI002FC3C4FD